MKNFIYLTLTVCLAVSIIGCKEPTPVKKTKNKLDLKLAGYDYDRVSAIRDGKVSIKGADVSFEVSNIYVQTDSGIEKPEDLIGKRVGAPGYTGSSNTWI